MKAKRTVSAIISIAMLLSLFVVPVHAASNFTDVADSAYYANSVAWAVSKGITTGKTETTFAPNEQCTKAQILTFLWRAVGSPEPDVAKINELMTFPNNNPFTDLDGSEYYFKAAQWAFTQNMTTGNADFNPDTPCTRVYAVFYMHILEGQPQPNKYTMFDDNPNNPMLNAAVSWAVEKGITNGTTDTTFSPETICTRAQIVTFLYRYLGNNQNTQQTTIQQTTASEDTLTEADKKAMEQAIAPGQAPGGYVNSIPGVTFGPEGLTEEQRQRQAEKSGAILRGEAQLLIDENGNYYYEF